ncbi:MAG: hypothetical protein AAGA54_22605, partial [Myxococcota bacterium]
MMTRTTTMTSLAAVLLLAGCGDGDAVDGATEAGSAGPMTTSGPTTMGSGGPASTGAGSSSGGADGGTETGVEPPSVDADAPGTNTLGVWHPLASSTSSLEASVSWSVVDGPGPVVFDQPASLETTALFFVPGPHTLQVEVTTPGGSATAEVVVTAETVEGTAAVFAPEARELEPTLSSLGLEWDLSDDPEHDAYGLIRWRTPGDAHWQRSLPLMRIDYAYLADSLTGYSGVPRPGNPLAFDMLAGSALFLEPGVTYEVEVLLADPSGSFASDSTTVQMRAEPTWPTEPDVHVVPGGGGGTGTEADPYRGIAAAVANVQPGQTVWLHEGDYGSAVFSVPGMPGQRTRWVAAPGEVPSFSSVRIDGSHVGVFGLRLVGPGDGGPGLAAFGEADEDIVVMGCSFTGFNYSVNIGASRRNWILMDNDIVGDDTISSFSGEGIELGYTSGHVVAYNRFSNVADATSYPTRHCDFYNNDIIMSVDDGFEPDFGYANNRFWFNRVRNVHANPLSFQPQLSGPWYFLFNQIYDVPPSYDNGIPSQSMLKFNGQVDRNVFIHNTFVREDGAVNGVNLGNPLFTFFSRNNLYLTRGEVVLRASSYGGNEYVPPMSYYALDWRADLDHDGFSQSSFVWPDATYEDVATWAAALGIEPAGITVPVDDLAPFD